MAINWGSSVIPKNQWIDINRKYTSNGCEVINLQIVLHNSNNKEVTYPVKGSVIVRKKPLKVEYMIWSLDGKRDVVWGNDQKTNLIEVH